MMKQTVVSHPKSGRTWLRVMLADLGVSVEMTHLDSGPTGSDYGRHFQRLRTAYSVAGKVVFLHRDPRDVSVSYFHHMKRARLSFSRRIKRGLLGRLPPSDIDKFVLSPRWGCEKTIRFNLNCLKSLRALPIAYEDLRTEPEKGLRSILEYFQLEFESREIAKAIRDNSFSNMQRREKAGVYAQGEFSGRFSTVSSSDQNSLKVRRGKVGSWKDELSEDTQHKLTQILERTNYFSNIEILLKQLNSSQ